MKQAHRIAHHLSVAAATLLAVAGAQAQGSVASGGYALGSGQSYIGLNAGRSEFALGSGSGLYAFDKRDTVYSVYAGSYFNNSFGFEFGYTDFGRASRGGGRSRAEGINLNLVGRLPLGDSFHLLGKLGTTYGRTDVSSLAGSGIAAGREKDFGLAYGVGVEYALNPKLSAVLQYDEHDLQWVGSGSDRVNTTTLGLRYRY